MNKFVLILSLVISSSSFGMSGGLKLLTEEYPPISYTNSSGKVDGLATEVVNEIMKRIGESYPVSVLPWVRAYKRAQNDRNVALFSVARTSEREKLFQWVGPIFTMRSSFYTLKNSKIKISSFDDAKKLPIIGANRAAFDTEILLKKGFKNLDLMTRPESNVAKLMRGRFEVITATNVAIKSIVQKAGFTVDQVKPLFPIVEVDNYIAFSKDVPIDLIKRWQKALSSMKKDGTLKKIEAKWLK